jgi:sulfur carrier protein
MRLTVNGQTHELPGPLSVSALLEHLALAGKRIAVERNGQVVPRSLHPETPLCDGDRLEIIVAVGGG